MVNKIDYSFLIGLKKNLKANVVTLVPFAIAMMASVPVEYAWIASAVTYQLKNMYEIKTGKKLI